MIRQLVLFKDSYNKLVTVRSQKMKCFLKFMHSQKTSTGLFFMAVCLLETVSKKRDIIFTVCTSRDTTPSDLPENEPKAVHVGHDVWLKMTSVQSLIQNLWRHVPLCTDSSVGGDVYLICVTMESDERNNFKLKNDRLWLLWNNESSKYFDLWKFPTCYQSLNSAEHCFKSVNWNIQIMLNNNMFLTHSPDKLDCQS